ncbi:hypothetical protein F5146DRAFT_1102349 [Armillaria mellea]|nr:hypothetical protein F5146DRAFT_1102349 [Armillaria mellea]
MRHEDHLHFIHQSIHLLTYISPETVHIGPLSSYAQWVMEMLIGSLGDEICQDLDPYANVQINCICFQLPNIQLTSSMAKDGPPANSKQVDNTNYYLLPWCQDTLFDVTDLEAAAIMVLWKNQGWPNAQGWPRAVRQWDRLCLPNGQVAHSPWMEMRPGIHRSLQNTRNIKLTINRKTEFTEVLYYFQLCFEHTHYTLALVSTYSPPDTELLHESSETVYSCEHQGDTGFCAVFVSDIVAVVAMVPLFDVTGKGEVIIPENQYFLVEKLGLDVTVLQREEEQDIDGDEDVE